MRSRTYAYNGIILGILFGMAAGAYTESIPIGVIVAILGSVVCFLVIRFLENMLGKGIDKATGKVLIEVSPDFYRLTDVVNLWGDPTKAKQELGWNPTKTSFEELVRIMVDHDMKKVAVERAEEHIATNLEEYLEKGVVK